MEKLDLHEILIKHIPAELYDPSLDKYYLTAMKEACMETINLCVEAEDTLCMRTQLPSIINIIVDSII